ncbi:uncharacterized protein LOC144744202 [Ciona intestinalis]
MSTKAIKVSLKAAKAAIQQKEFDEALLHCKAVLKEDSGNYNGLVFAGLVYAELGQFENSSTAYQDAVKASPDQPLAYQGIINLYTKHKKVKLSAGENDQLVSAYEGIITLTESSANEAKTLELYVGLANTLCSLGRAEESFNTLQKVCNKLNAEQFDVKFEAIYAAVVTTVGIAQDANIAGFADLIINCSIWFCKSPTKLDKERDSALLTMMKCFQKDSTTYDKCLKLLAQFLLSGDFTLTSLMKDLLIQIKLQTGLDDYFFFCFIHKRYYQLLFYQYYLSFRFFKLSRSSLL